MPDVAPPPPLSEEALATLERLVELGIDRLVELDLGAVSLNSSTLGSLIAEARAGRARATDLDKARTLGTVEAHVIGELWKHMSDEQRLQLVRSCCTGCGCLDPRCRCVRLDPERE